MMITTNRCHIVATILARNEEDIIGPMIEHHVGQGVNRFIVTDNDSRDRTRAIAASYPEVAEIIDEPGDTHSQSEWVTRMARVACKMNPDWIVHLDADEFWCGLTNLSRISGFAVSCRRMFLHPPVGNDEFRLVAQRHYLDCAPAGLPDEAKIAHRPNPDVIVAHGNHGLISHPATAITTAVWRHHYPIRSYGQFLRKATEGHVALVRRGVVCERWQRWHTALQQGILPDMYQSMCARWGGFCRQPNQADLLELLGYWSTGEVVAHFRNGSPLPVVGEWPSPG